MTGEALYARHCAAVFKHTPKRWSSDRQCYVPTIGDTPRAWAFLPGWRRQVWNEMAKRLQHKVAVR